LRIKPTRCISSYVGPSCIWLTLHLIQALGYLSLHHESLTNIDKSLSLAPSSPFGAELTHYMASARDELYDALSSALEESMLRIVIGCVAKETAAQVWMARKKIMEEIRGGGVLLTSNETTAAGNTDSASQEGTPPVSPGAPSNAMDLA
jgi:hypothetical protein